MKTYQNDTYGEITEAELQALCARALPCTTCGQVATVDPVFHRDRYLHAPTICENGTNFVFWAGRWTAQKGAER